MQLDHRGPPPRRGEVEVATAVGELGRAAHLVARCDDQLLGEGHDVAVVGVGLVELEHRELGVVAGRDALVAEHPADLEHPLEAADHQPLEVQLGGDAQEQVQVERVVVGDERLGRGPARDRVEDGVSTSMKPAVLQPPAGEADDPAAQNGTCAGLLGDPQVDVALAVAGVGVGDAVPLVGERAAGLGQQHQSSTVTDSSPRRVVMTSPVTPIQSPSDRSQNSSNRASTAAGEQLDATGGVGQRAEGELALDPSQHHPAGDGDGVFRLGAVGQVGVLRVQLGRGGGAVESVRRRNAHSVFISWMRRRPCRVSHGSMMGDRGRQRRDELGQAAGGDHRARRRARRETARPGRRPPPRTRRARPTGSTRPWSCR